MDAMKATKKRGKSRPGPEPIRKKRRSLKTPVPTQFSGFVQEPTEPNAQKTLEPNPKKPNFATT